MSLTSSFWVVLATTLSVSINALHLPSNELALPTSEKVPEIELIDVKCDKNENGMHVSIQFSQPFDGIIYSRGFFNDPKCRYVTVGENEKSFNFVVPFEGCGSKPSCSVCSSIDNILIIQHDEEVQGEFDTARKISCSRSGAEEDKKVYFKPFIVDMLDVVSVPTSTGGVDCWMDIQRGTFPTLNPIGEVIKIGEELAVLVYLRDPNKEYDLSVRNCWAYDGADFDDKKTGKVQLSDASGCSMKRKLFGSWHKTTKTGSSGANLLLHNTLRAFKFPDESQVYLKCDIEICRGNCAEAICEADGINLVDCALDPLNSKCREKLYETTTLEFTTTEFATRAPFADATKAPKFDSLTTERFNEFSTTYLSQRGQFTTGSPETTTFKEITTHPNLYKTTTVKPVYDSFCNRYPSHKRCNQRVTDDLNGNVEILTFKPPSPFVTVKSLPTNNETPRTGVNCAQYPNHARCQKSQIVLTTEASEINELPFTCKGKFLDPRCPNPTPTATPPTYLPPGGTRKTKPTTKFFICVPGSNDVRCDDEYSKVTDATTIIVRETTTAIPSRDQYTTKKQTICSFGSLNPECRKVSTDILTFKPKTETTSIPSATTYTPLCYPGSLDPKCRKVATTKPTTFRTEPQLDVRFDTTPIPVQITTRAPICYPGALDPRCAKITTTQKAVPITSTTQVVTTETPSTTTPRFIPSTTSAVRCYPGSLDPRCVKIATTQKAIPITSTTQAVSTDIPSTTTPRFIPSVTNAVRCYPGSLDSRCFKSVTTTQKAISTDMPSTTTSRYIQSTTNAVRCYPGSLDPRCVKITTTQTPLPSITTTQAANTEPPTPKFIANKFNVPRCYPGSLDPNCLQSTTARAIVTQQPSLPSVPRCYLGSLDPRCSKNELVVPLVCTPGPSGLPLDPRCPNPTPTAQPATYLPPFPSFTTTKKPIPAVNLRTSEPEKTTRFTTIPTTTQRPYTTFTTGRIISTLQPTFSTTLTPVSTTTLDTTTLGTTTLGTSAEISTTQTPTTTDLYTTSTKGPFSFSTFTTKGLVSTQQPIYTTRFVPISTTTDGPITTTQFPSTTQRPVYTTFTTKRIIPSLQPTVIPRFHTDTTTTQIPTTTTRPTTPRTPFTFPTFSTNRMLSSPQPFNTRPTSTTENPLCYPGSPIEGCKSTFTTPSYCFPGSNDKRCPQLPPSFSTRMPSTYLPPFLPSELLNRVRRHIPFETEPNQEVVKFSLSFKPFDYRSNHD